MISYLFKMVALTAFLVVLIAYATDHSKAADANDTSSAAQHSLS